MYTDEAPKVKELFANLKRNQAELEKLLEKCNGHWIYEDSIYRFYHQSFKVFYIQDDTLEIVKALQALLPDAPMNGRFLKIVEEGTGKEFKFDDNVNWSTVTRPMIEAFFHARFFLEMAVKYGKELEFPPRMMPSGWAAFLYLFNLR